jgi:acyl carrier protein
LESQPFNRIGEAARNDRGDRGNVGIIRSPNRVSILTDLAVAGDFGRLCTVHEAQIYERLTRLLQDIFDDDSISVTPELSAKDVDGWDSVTHIRLMLTVERAFRTKFSTSEIGNLKNIGDLVTLIKART